MNAKYVVIKADEWAAITAGDPSLSHPAEKWEAVAEAPLDPETYFVIREGDVFASSALHAYAHALMTALELDDERHMLTDDERDHLSSLVDDLTSLGMAWQARQRRVPD